MPAFNLKSKKLRYHGADETILETAIALLKTMAEYDSTSKKDTTDAASSLSLVLTYIKQQRKPAKPEAK